MAMTDFALSLAIVIGIDAYSNGIRPLTTAVNDAARLAELLRATHGYETILLTEPAIGQPVTREHLRTLLEDKLPARLGDDDRLLVYFAGHGVALEDKKGPAGYLIPQDARPDDVASYLPMTDLHAWLTALPCRHLLAILDCCFAGAFRWAATRDLGARPEMLHKERYDRYLPVPMATRLPWGTSMAGLLYGIGRPIKHRDCCPGETVAQYSVWLSAAIIGSQPRGVEMPQSASGTSKRANNSVNRSRSTKVGCTVWH